MNDAEAPLVFETPGGLSVSYRGRLLYSGREPESLPRRVAASCDRGPARLLLVPSPLLWYGVPELLAAMGAGSALLCVEADPELAALARERMPRELSSDPRLAFLEGTSREEGLAAATALAAASARGSFRACSLVVLSGGESLHAGEYEALADALSSSFESEWRNRAALMILGPRWAKNIFDNMAALGEIEMEPLPRFPGPVVVCGAGPSLEGALPFIAKEASAGRLAVLACDTALGTLLAAGIEPDLVICLEGQAHNLPDFTCLGSRRASLAADLSSHPATFRVVRGPKHLSLVRITRSPLLDRARAALRDAGLPFLDLPPLGSVGVHAFHLARISSEGPLFATGLDFSFEPGKTHARGCPSLGAEERRLTRLTRWPGQFAVSFRDRCIKLGAAGGEAPGLLSDPVLLSYAALLAQGGDRDGAGRLAMYDLRGRGPDIGCRRMTLAQAEALVEGLGRRPAAVREGSPASRPRSRAAARSFLGSELARLERLREALRGGARARSEELRTFVAEADYLWWGFPDQARAGELAQDFLNRLVPQLEYWRYRLGELVSELGRG